MVDTSSFQTHSDHPELRPPICDPHRLLNVAEELNGLMDMFSFLIVTTHFISAFFVIRSRPLIVWFTNISHARHSFIIHWGQTPIYPGG